MAELKERRRQKKLEKDAKKQMKEDLDEIEIMKKDEKYAGKTDEELLVILREERDNAVRKI